MAGCLMFSSLLCSTAFVPPPATAWWDAVWFGNLMVGAGLLIALVGVVAAFVGIRAAYHIYRSQQRDAINEQRQATLAHLKGVKAAMEAWAKDYFDTSYAGAAAKDRAELDFNAIMQGSYFQNFRVSPEPVASLLQPPGEAWPIDSETITVASIALLRMGQFNQLVQQQTDFNALHAAEIRDEALGDNRRLAIAKSGRRISEIMHGDVIGDAKWYKGLMKALDKNIQDLDHSTEEIGPPSKSDAPNPTS